MGKRKLDVKASSGTQFYGADCHAALQEIAREWKLPDGMATGSILLRGIVSLWRCGGTQGPEFAARVSALRTLRTEIREKALDLPF